MKIRSVTYFLDPGYPLQTSKLQAAGDFLAAARRAYEGAGYEVQTVRLATIPFPRLVPDLQAERLMDLAQEFERIGRSLGIEYLALGPALPEFPQSYALIPDAIGATQSVFLSALMTGPDGQVSLPAVHACAEVIERNIGLSSDGFAHLRFGALANVPPGGPFLPGAYHRGGPPVFALATQAAGLAVRAFSEAASLEAGRRALVAVVEDHARRLESVARQLEGQGANFGGLDFTLAPFPEEALSFGTAMEHMGVPAVGLHGSLAAAALITDTLDTAQYPRAGFNGLMLPVLEDAILARRAAEGRLTVKDLLMYAAVCGTGLDTVPLPGSVSRGQLAAVLLDIAALSQRLDKPLIARLMPIPGKAAGDPTDFDFAYFANSRVLDLEAEGLQGLLAGEETFSVAPRSRR